ncbi:MULTISPECIES: hypothetical protein [Streptomyces]|uniref:Uncharacterized protein n=2 Tax=Streptomyces TaxID=1883 RepID=A0A3M8FBB7_9ACTN|nr:MULTISPECIES: hypothetical protein [Streptomyces]KNE80595.1 hypothetical protein ADZ36_20985 [Streptomyces fradiae]OFA61726.1 hypothetical protein BEN35_01130 [Streptomyces fradiae]PQM24377.1 hypothetical protein Sfr7A_06285 [Streptomyces xinghaiensis]RKM98044.1 hypothetical protein SFRA_005815 [Streptomyces xinghaiensis]RNC75260.1 hypothetical protein DC095_005625 [Streptomyces xinghaiensis]
MKLRFLGKNSTTGDCPTLYATDRDTYLVQGWRIYANDLLMRLEVPEGETAVEVPTELFEHLTEDGLPTGEIRRVEDPVMILTPGGTFVVQGRKVTDPEALARMEIPDYETVVEVPKTAITALLEEPRGADLQRRAQPAL